MEVRWFGRRGTLAVGAAITTALQLGYTQVKTPAQNPGVSELRLTYTMPQFMLIRPKFYLPLTGQLGTLCVWW